MSREREARRCPSGHPDDRDHHPGKDHQPGQDPRTEGKPRVPWWTPGSSSRFRQGPPPADREARRKVDGNMKAIRLVIIENPIHDVHPRKTSYVVRPDGLGGIEIYESTEGTAMSDTEKWLSVGLDREFDLKISVETCDV